MSLRIFLLKLLERDFIKRPIKALLKRISKTPPGLIKIAMFDIRFAQFEGLTIIPRTWYEFFKKHSAEIEDLFEALLSGMDEKSIETARLVWERNVTFGPLSKFTDLVYVPADSFFTEEELKAQRYVEGLINKVKRNYKLPIDHYEEPVFIYEHGLTFVKEVLNGGAEA
ncbi:MAG: hypothetical protein N2327_00815 [Caldimicrobium sp.]|nr:hypothetical protein [Caldimicrobium sp.]MCX7872963.1 hypothetical protein [Caldimicrobium sp.]MDW8094581.1 hypothetical protein [Caldimicrobium sp.]